MVSFKVGACHRPSSRVLAQRVLSTGAEVIEGCLQQTTMCHLSLGNHKRKKCFQSETILQSTNHLRLQERGICVLSLCGQSQIELLHHFFGSSDPCSRGFLLLNHSFILVMNISDLAAVLREPFRRNAALEVSIVQNKELQR